MYNFNLALTSFRGETTGRIKDLAGFDKTHHRLSVSDPTGAKKLLSTLGEAKIEREGQELFQQIRTALGYKRREIAFSREGAVGVIACTDFELTLSLIPKPDDTREFLFKKKLAQVRDAEFIFNPAFNQVFQNAFHGLTIMMENPVDIEAWIDRIEERDLEKTLELIYPPDCSFCEMRLPGSDFIIRVTNEAFTLSRPVVSPPSTLYEAFIRFREKVDDSL